MKHAIKHIGEEKVDFKQIVQIIEERRYRAYRKVNEELIGLYWDFGKYINELVKKGNYGDKIITNIVEFMKKEYPTIKGFNKRNIERMVQFYKTYVNDEIASPLLTQLSWTNNLIILSSAKTIQERHFYLKLSIKNNYSSRELERQIKSSYYERYKLSDDIKDKLVSTIKNDTYPSVKILDTYSFSF